MAVPPSVVPSGVEAKPFTGELAAPQSVEIIYMFIVLLRLYVSIFSSFYLV